MEKKDGGRNEQSKKKNNFRQRPEIRDSILNTKYASMYLEIFDEIAHNKIKLQDKNLFNYKSKYESRNHWHSLTSEILSSNAYEIAYKYCLHKAKSKVSTELAVEAQKRKIRIKDAIYLYLKTLRQSIKRSSTLIGLERKNTLKFLKNTAKSQQKTLITEINASTVEDSESDTEKQLTNFNNMFAKKFPLNIFVGSNMNLSNKKLKVYHGKYIRTFIVNNSMKRDLTSKTENKNPYEERIKGNYIYFEEQPKKLFKKRKNTKSPKKSPSSKTLVVLPKLEIPPVSEVKPQVYTSHEEKSEKLDFLKNNYGLRYKKNTIKKTFEEDVVQVTKGSTEAQISFQSTNNRLMTQSRTEPFLAVKTKSKRNTNLLKATTTSFFKNDEFYYFNSNV